MEGRIMLNSFYIQLFPKTIPAQLGKCLCIVTLTGHMLLNFLAYTQLFGAEQSCSEDASSPTKYLYRIYLIVYPVKH